MRIICAWCKTEIGFRCPKCGDKLFPHPDDPRLMICRNPPTALVYGIEHMGTSHGICEACRRHFDRTSKKERTP